MAQTTEFHIPITLDMATQKVSLILADASGLSQQQIKHAMQHGAVWLESNIGTRRIRRANSRLHAGNRLHFYYAPEVLKLVPPTPQLIADEQEYSVWHKPTGMLCQGSKWSDHCTINRWIETQHLFEQQPQRNSFIVHRLDKAARGLVLIAHTKKATQKLAGLFEQKKIEKHYRIIVEGEFPEEEQIIDSKIDGKPAHSIARRLFFDAHKQHSLLDVQIKTGRKHQIRIHMQRSGHPVIGDRLHGNAHDRSPDLQLQSFSLSFTCPLSEQIKRYSCPNALTLVL